MLYFPFHDHKSNLYFPFVSFQHVDKSVIRPIAFKPIITPQTRYVPAPAQSKLSPRQPGSHDLKSTNHNTDDGYVSQEYNSGTYHKCSFGPSMRRHICALHFEEFFLCKLFFICKGLRPMRSHLKKSSSLL